jgi:hypothetical protein
MNIVKEPLRKSALFVKIGYQREAITVILVELAFPNTIITAPGLITV